METEIKNEFEAFLKVLIETYPKADTTVRKNPTSLSEVGKKSKNFNEKAKNKINELASKYGKSEHVLRIELSEILVKYHSNLVKNNL